MLDALDDAEHAPRDVVVDAGELAGSPDQCDDRERSVGLDVQGVALVVVGGAEAPLGGQDVGGGQVPSQLFGDELRGLGAVGVALDGGADAGDERAQSTGAALGCDGGHSVSLPAVGSYVQCQLSC